ncbi:MAG: sensor histidine kinase RegB, partial [Roseovarius sp.]
MVELSPEPLKSPQRGNWIRLRTLVLLRWWAIVGQATALIIAQRVYGLDLEIGLCFLVIGVSIVSNLVASFVFAENKRLSEHDTFQVVLF